MQNTWVKRLLLVIATFWDAGTLAAQTSSLPAPGTTDLVRHRTTATWQGQEFGVVLDRIAASAPVHFWLDRRVDPQQLVNAQFDDATLADVLDELTADKSLGWSSWEGILYVGSHRAADEMATLLAIARDKASRLPPETRRRWLQAEPVIWPRLSDPREILLNWLAAAGIELSGREMLSHDLWHAKELPAMPLVDRVVLLLAGFGMTCDISADGRTCRVVRVEQPVFIIREYAAGSRARQLVEEFKEEPGVTVTRRGSKLQLAGRWEDHQRAAEILSAGATRRNRSTNAVPREIRRSISLRLENQPVGKVIDQLAQQLDLDVVWRASPAERDKLVSCAVSNGTVQELLKAVLEPVGLEFRLNDKRLEIVSGEY